MAKREMYKFLKRLDENKYDLADKGITFYFAVREDGENFNVGAGSTEDMLLLILRQLFDVYNYAVEDKTKTTAEKFADSVKQNLIKYIKAYRK